MRLSSLLALLALGACQTEDAPPTDRPAPDLPWLDAGTPTIAPPEIDWLDAGAPPVAPPARTCPAGWVEEPLDAGGHACNPWPSGARATCDDAGMAQRPGTDACVALGSTCPSGTWPDDAGTTNTWYVAEGGAGDGSASAPFGTLAEAIATAAAGDTVILGEGTFDTAIVVSVDLTIRGLCPSATRLTHADASPDDALIEVSGATLTLSDLTLGDTAAMGIVVTDGAVEATGVAIDTVGGMGISATSSTVDLTDVRIHAVQPRSDDATLGRGIALFDAQLTADGLTIDASRQAGVWIEGDSGSATLTDWVTYDMLPEAATANRGVALRSIGGGDLTLSRVVVEGGYDYGIGGLSAGNTSVEDAWISGIHAPLDDGAGFCAIGGQGSGDLHLAGVTITDVEAQGLAYYPIDGTVGTLDGEDIVVRGLRRGWGASYGGAQAVRVNTVTSVTLTRLQITDSEDFGTAFFNGPVTLTDIDVRETRYGVYAGEGAELSIDRAILKDNSYAQLMGWGGSITATNVLATSPNAMGIGYFTYDASSLDLSHSLFTDVASAGIVNDFAGSTTTLTDVILRDTRPNAGWGLGVGVVATGDVTLTRVSVEGAVGAGLELHSANFSAEDLSVTDVVSRTDDGGGGFGVLAENTDATFTRAAIVGAQCAGFACDDCTVTATDLYVADVIPATCATSTCLEDTAATGLYFGPDAQASLTTTLVEACESGLQVRGSVTATDVLLRDNAVGLDSAHGAVTGERLGYDGNATDETKMATAVPAL